VCLCVAMISKTRVYKNVIRMNASETYISLSLCLVVSYALKAATRGLILAYQSEAFLHIEAEDF